MSGFASMLKKEIVLEWRQKHAFGGILLYLASSIFVAYLSFSQLIEPRAWNALFWIILLFAAMQATLKGFLQESSGRMLYYYTLVSPFSLIAAKMVHLALLMLILSITGLGIYILFMGNPIGTPLLFILCMILGVTGFASVLGMISAIAAKARNNFTLMGVLGFPLILPLLLMVTRVSEAAVAGKSLISQGGNLAGIVLLISISYVLSGILFPFVFKE